MRRSLVAGAFAVAAGAWWTRRRWRDWGATATERGRTWPGEQSIPEPSTSTTFAVSIDAPAEDVWSWLVQIGQDRAGMYSYEVLENLFGLAIHNADEIHDDWQHLQPGDRVAVVPPGRLGLPDGYAFDVAEVVPPHHLVLRQAPPAHPWNSVWTFTIEPDGTDGSRLVSRSRTQRQTGLGGRIADVAGLTMEPVIMLMTRRMLLGIKERAERPSSELFSAGAAETTGRG